MLRREFFRFIGVLGVVAALNPLKLVELAEADPPKPKTPDFRLPDLRQYPGYYIDNKADIRQFPGSPGLGWMVPDGRALSRKAYPELYEALKYSYGRG